MDIFKKQFICDLNRCQGACCVEGDSGAPLTEEEAVIIEQTYDKFEEYLEPKYKEEVEKQGFSVVDEDGDLVTPILGTKECVYTYVDGDGSTKCAIEKAFLEGRIDFRKPVSCHLFPVRITEYSSFDAVNYQELDICQAALCLGAKEKLPLYKFLKEPLIRKYGEDWYNELELVGDALNEEDN